MRGETARAGAAETAGPRTLRARGPGAGVTNDPGDTSRGTTTVPTNAWHLGAWRVAGPAIVAAAALAVALVATSGADAGIAIVSGAIVVLCASGIVYAVVTGLRPVALVFFTFTFAWLGVAPVYQLATGEVPWGDTTGLADRGLVLAALALTVLAVASFWVGTLLGARRGGWKRRHEAPGGAPRGGDFGHRMRRAPTRARHVTGVRAWMHWAIVAAGVVISPYVIASHGGIATFFGSRAERSAALAGNGMTLESVGGAQYAIVSILPVALAIAASILAVERLRPFARRRALADAPLEVWLSAAVSLALLVVFTNPFTNSRFIASLAFGALALAIVRPRSPRAAGVVAVIALTVVLLAYPLAELFRTGFDDSADVLWLRAFGTYDFDGFLQVVNTLEYTDLHGHSHGWYLLSAAAFAVPRSMWTGKANPASIDVAGDAGYDFTNLSLPIHAELYLEFGIAGVAVGMLAVGWAAAHIDSAWRTGADTRLTVLAPVFALAMLGFVRGPLGSLVPIYAAAIVLVLVSLRAPRRRELGDSVAALRPSQAGGGSRPLPGEPTDRGVSS